MLSSRPNIIYFNPDQMRGDFMGCSGHPTIKTPNFDRLAAAGTLFNQCHVQHTVCTPSRCSFMTGWYPHVSGHRTLWNCLQPHEPNTMKYFKDAGYNVQMMGKNDLFSPEAVEQSLTHFHSIDVDRMKTGKRPPKGDPHFNSFLYSASEQPTHDDLYLERALDFLNQQDDNSQPFFLFLPWIFPHCPFFAPEPWHSMYTVDDVADLRPANFEGKPSFYSLIHKNRDLDKLSERELKKITAVYMGMISYVDHLLGKVLDCLEERGLWDNTAIFAFSDHGEWGGDYGLVEKWTAGMDDCLTRVPMVVKPPCSSQDSGFVPGTVVNDPIECHDIMPTSLELAGIECRHTHFAVSMMPQLKGTPGDPNRAVYTEGGHNTNEPHCFEGYGERDAELSKDDHIYHQKLKQQQDTPLSASRATSLRTASHRYVKRPFDQDELYDLVADPMETENLIDHPAHATVLAELKERMIDWYVNTADVVPMIQDPRGFSEDHPLRIGS
jgi:choline-sulfatase